jgi:hypothetical protein
VDAAVAAVLNTEVVYAGNMASVEPVRGKSLLDYRKKLLEHKEVESRLKESMHFLELLLFLANIVRSCTRIWTFY